ncbi:MAG TPA: hypothetical protein VF503_19905 [Sphingobium sp.]|uniref:hypothetical protein n=1 Tax=Sphingobium sp. TaxID=1912891 RepID=UPI002ED5AB0A
MTIAFSPPHQALPYAQPPASSHAMIVDAARCWQAARERHESLQPCLSGLLAHHDCGMLTPVLDSLFLLYEAGLGREVRSGDGEMLSDDEDLLLGLLDGSRARRACIDCTEGVASALDCAICSTRIMLAMIGRAVSSPRLHGQFGAQFDA